MEQQATPNDSARAAKAAPARALVPAKSARDVLAMVTQRQTQRLNNSWAVTASGHAAQIQRQLVPLLDSSDATLRARGNILLQDMLRLAFARARTDIAVAVVRTLAPAQLRALAPESVAALMLAIHQVRDCTMHDLDGMEVSRAGNEWSFASTGEVAVPREGILWRASTPCAPPVGDALAAARELAQQGPRGMSYAMPSGRLIVRYLSVSGRYSATGQGKASTGKTAAPTLGPKFK